MTAIVYLADIQQWIHLDALGTMLTTQDRPYQYVVFWRAGDVEVVYAEPAGTETTLIDPAVHQLAKAQRERNATGCAT